MPVLHGGVKWEARNVIPRCREFIRVKVEEVGFKGESEAKDVAGNGDEEDVSVQPEVVEEVESEVVDAASAEEIAA